MVETLTTNLEELAIDESTEFLDITDKFFNLVGQLKSNQVAQHASFSLFEGTHALEILHSNLDTGLIKLKSAEAQVANFSFDKESPLSLNDILSISDRLFRLIFIWVNNRNLLSTLLSTTVLSCVYVERILDNYTKHPSIRHATLYKFSSDGELKLKEDFLELCEQELAQLQLQGPASLTDEQKRKVATLQNFILTHKVFRSIILGIIFFAAFVIKLAKAGILYEEEDIISQVSGFDLFEKVQEIDILQELVSSSIWLIKTFRTELNDAEVKSTRKLPFSLLNNLLAVIRNLIEFPKLLTKNFGVNLKDAFLGNDFDRNNTEAINLTFINTIITNLNPLIENDAFLVNLAKESKNVYTNECFSKGVQKRASNTRPINEIADPFVINYKSIKEHYFVNFEEYLANLSTIVQGPTTIIDIANFFKKMYYNSKTNNIILKAYLQLFFVRDTKSILGSNKLLLIHLALGSMNYISSWETNCMNILFSGSNKGINYGSLDTRIEEFIHLDVDKSHYYPSYRDSVEVILNYDLLGLTKGQFRYSVGNNKVKAKEKAAEFFLNLEGLYFEILGNASNNPSRQRQVLSRLIVQFDSLQVVSEQLDMLLFEKCGLNDVLVGSDTGSQVAQPALPFSSFVYYLKLKAMIDYSLKGFELDIYKTWEYPLIYWYNYYLIDNMCGLLDRQIQYNKYKVLKIKDKLKEVEGRKLTKAAKPKKSGNATILGVSALSKKFENEAAFNFHLSNVLSKNSAIASLSTSPFAKFQSESISILNDKLAKLKLVEAHLQDLKTYYTGELQLNYGIFLLLNIYNYFGLIKHPELSQISTMIAKNCPHEAAGSEANGASFFEERLYRLRMKSFSTVGVPEFLKYQTFKWNTSELISSIVETGTVEIDTVHDATVTINLTKFTTFLDNIIDYLTNARSGFKQASANCQCETSTQNSGEKQIRTPLESEVHRINQLVKSCITYSLTVFKLKKIINLVSKKYNSEQVTREQFVQFLAEEKYECMKEVKGQYRYYPLISVEQRK